MVLQEKLTPARISVVQTTITPSINNAIKSAVVSDGETQNLPTIVHSYAGSNPDGAVNLDDNGLVIVDVDLRRLFNYFLSASGELNQSQILQQLSVFTTAHLNPKQKQQVLQLFDKYRLYLVAVDQFAASLDSGLSQLEVMSLLSEMRVELLGDDMAQAFFNDQEKYLEFVTSHKNTDNAGFSEQQAQWLNSENNATLYLDTVIENNQYLQSSSITQAEIYSQRVEKYGKPAAQRLLQLDSQRQRWQATVDDYFVQRQLLNTDINDVLMLNSRYTIQDSRRLQALWRIRSSDS